MVVLVDVLQPQISIATGLTYNQENRYKALHENETFSKVSEVLLSETHDQFLIYGGMAMLIERDDVLPVLDSTVPICSDMVTEGGLLTEKLDSTRNADIDLMVDDIGNVNQLITILQDQLGDGYEVVGSNLADYPRVDIIQNGVEVMSISDLKTSVGTVKEINNKLGIENTGTDLEIYMRAKLLKNDMDPILVNNQGSQILMLSGREVVTYLIEINEQSIFSPGVAQELFENGEVNLANMVMREWAYNVGKVAVMTQFGMRMAPEVQDKWRNEVVENASWAGESLDIMKTLSKRMVKAANGNFGWFKMVAINFGFLSWYTGDLDEALLETYNSPDKWQKLVRMTNQLDEEMAEGTFHSVGDFVDAVLDGVDEKQKTKIKSEFTDHWNPGPMDGVAFAGGKKIKTV
ncbi:hypothetical protein HYV64_04985 [Candidatus Shapirobacteria bacterium]|nr:hypothetical protein [Candidatus Shapirobacteria bacterium]